ncbi:TauD/TfdA family dioxygenase [Sphaerisporangium corydalis]|uniref:TauD/TfdA family dioxygenase n=1 Tax=Sphaerisporangium corydalis TaxID=1441875 RepID=A0ABV9EER1_9ACTN|nr:TauD/TfdA family dioxygenase [Sphaerisporangium corydalis]
MPELETRGAELSLTEETAGEIARWSSALAGDAYRAAERSRAEAPGLAFVAPDLAAEVVRFGRLLGRAGLLRVTGVRIPGRLPPTPGRPYVEVRRPVGTEPLLLAVAGLAGEVVSFADWHGGDRVQNLYPLRSEAGRQNASNAVHLEMHTETAFRPTTPDALALLCLRHDDRARTLACDLLDVWAGLDSGVRRALAEPAYAFELPGGTTTEPKPVATEWRGRPRFNYADAVCSVDAEHRGALLALKEGIRDRTTQITLMAGDLLLIDNTHVVHGRTGYGPRYDGGDRWLQRCLIRAAPGERE